MVNTTNPNAGPGAQPSAPNEFTDNNPAAARPEEATISEQTAAEMDAGRRALQGRRTAPLDEQRLGQAVGERNPDNPQLPPGSPGSSAPGASGSFELGTAAQTGMPQGRGFAPLPDGRPHPDPDDPNQVRIGVDVTGTVNPDVAPPSGFHEGRPDQAMVHNPALSTPPVNPQGDPKKAPEGVRQAAVDTIESTVKDMAAVGGSQTETNTITKRDALENPADTQQQTPAPADEDDGKGGKKTKKAKNATADDDELQKIING